MKPSIIAIAAGLATTPAVAQEQGRPGSEDDIIVLGELELEAEAAGRLALTNRETPAVVDSVSQEDFQNQGLRNTIEAMNAAPGVASGTLPGSIGSVSMRGLHRAVNYLYDGVRMPEYCWGGEISADRQGIAVGGPAPSISGEKIIRPLTYAVAATFPAFSV